MRKNKLILLLFVSGIICSCQQPTAALFEKLAKEQTRRCPITIDEYTTLDSVIYKKNTNVNQYYYTLTGEADNRINVQKNKESAREALIRELRNEVEMKKYKDFNTTLEYIYISRKDGSELANFQIEADQY